MGMTVSVAGASGYAGGELLRLIAGHPRARPGRRHRAQPRPARRVAAVHPQLAGARPDARPRPTRRRWPTPTWSSSPCRTASRRRSPPRCPPTVKVVDLGADFRLARRRRRGRATTAAPHAGTWTYGLPELPGQRARDRRRRPGGRHRLLRGRHHPRAGAADRGRRRSAPDDVVVVAASGTSGAGRAPKPHLLASEVMGDLSPYKVGAHQHVPEIKQATGARGAVVHAGARADAARHPGHRHRRGRPRDAATAREVLRGGVRRRAVRARAAEGAWPHTAATLGSNSCHLQATVDVDTGRVIVVSAHRQPRQGRRRPGRAVRQPDARPAGDGRPVRRTESRRERHRARRGSGRPASPPGSRPAAAPTSRWSSTTGPTPTAAGVFTANRVKAAPVLWSQQVLAGGVRARGRAQLRRRQRLHRPAGLPGHPRHRRAHRGRADRRRGRSSAPATWRSARPG